MARLLLLLLTLGSFDQHDGPVTLRWQSNVDGGGVVLPFVERLPLVIEIAGPGPIEVRLPEPLIRVPGWREASRDEPMQDANGWRQRIVFEPLAPRDGLIPLEPWKYRRPGEEWQSASFPPLAVRVTTRTSADDDVPRDITGPLLRRIEPTDRRGWLIGVGVVLLIGVALAVRRLVGRRRTQDARRRALAALTRIERLKAPTDEQRCRLIANVLRRYVERRARIPARRRSTPEIVRLVAASAVLASSERFIAGFLQACDAAKFAPIPAASAERLAGELRSWIASAP